MQHNANGLTGKLDDMLNFMVNHNVDIAAIQETKWTTKSRAPKTPGYTIIRQDRCRDRGGGLAFFIRDNIPYPNPK